MTKESIWQNIFRRTHGALSEDTFDEAWIRLNSESRSFLDCVDVYNAANISPFYGEGANKKRRATWAKIFDEMMSVMNVDEKEQAIVAVVETLTPESQVGMVGALCEFVRMNDADWLGDLFSGLVKYSRSPDAPVGTAEAFELAVKFARDIHPDLIKKHTSIMALRRYDAYWASSAGPIEG
jgi:hypothetical protein